MTLLLTTQYHPLNTHALTHSRRAYTAARRKKLRLCLEAEECNTPKKRIPLKGGRPEKRPLRHKATAEVSSFVRVTAAGGRCRVTRPTPAAGERGYPWHSVRSACAHRALCVRIPCASLAAFERGAVTGTFRRDVSRQNHDTSRQSGENGSLPRADGHARGECMCMHMHPRQCARFCAARRASFSVRATMTDEESRAARGAGDAKAIRSGDAKAIRRHAPQTRPTRQTC
jgi:hypothetical protein